MLNIRLLIGHLLVQQPHIELLGVLSCDAEKWYRDAWCNKCAKTSDKVLCKRLGALYATCTLPVVPFFSGRHLRFAAALGFPCPWMRMLACWFCAEVIVHILICPLNCFYIMYDLGIASLFYLHWKPILDIFSALSAECRQVTASKSFNLWSRKTIRAFFPTFCTRLAAFLWQCWDRKLLFRVSLKLKVVYVPTKNKECLDKPAILRAHRPNCLHRPWRSFRFVLICWYAGPKSYWVAAHVAYRPARWMFERIVCDWVPHQRV